MSLACPHCGPRPLRVVVCDQRVWTRELLRRRLTCAGIDVVAEAAETADLAHILVALGPDVLVVNLDQMLAMPHDGGTSEGNWRDTDVAVVAYSQLLREVADPLAARAAADVYLEESSFESVDGAVTRALREHGASVGRTSRELAAQAA